MALLDQIKQMQQQGLNDNDIIRTFQEQGYSPMEINDALSQSQIKSAVNQEVPLDMQQQGMQPSMLQQEPQEQAVPIPQQYYQQQENYEQYPQQQYSGIESINETVEQILDEKLSSIKRKVSEASAIKSELDTKLELLEKRVKKIEDIIDKLESAVLQKIGEYSRGITDIKSELGMMQDSFSKALPHLASREKETSSKKK